MAATQSEIARRVGIDVSSVNKILNRSPRSVFKKDTIRQVFKAARELGYDLSRLKFQHRRRHPRKPVSIPLELSIYSPDGILEERGTARVQDLSLSGAQLSGIILPGQRLPIRPHIIGIRLLEGPLTNVELRCRPVRFLETPLGYNLGVEFIAVEARDLKLLRKIV